MLSMKCLLANLFWVPVLLSNIELYYASPENIDGNRIKLVDEEFRHAVKVMRNRTDDEIYVTDGIGNVYRTKILRVLTGELELATVEKTFYQNLLENFTLCIPRLKNPGRMEFALEKSVEFGFTKFIVFESERTVAKGEKIKRWEKILVAAMKQSLRSHLPEIKYESNLNNLDKNSTKIIFEQNAGVSFTQYLNSIDKNKKTYLLFGPEGGFSDRELDGFEKKVMVKLNKNRLRSETAIVSAASLLSNYFDS